MAFVIKNIKSGQTPENIATAIRHALTVGARFTADITTHRNKVEIREVRLTYKKDYCGNHPFACPIRPGQPHRPHKKLPYLEGADWVAFNDTLNDVLDSLSCVCDAGSSLLVIRKAGARAVKYGGQKTANGIDAEWTNTQSEFKNCIGANREIHAAYPQGTPGFATAYGQPNYPEHDHV